MPSFLERYQTDRELEDGGVWVDYGDELMVCVRRINSAKSREVRRKLEKPYARAFRNQDMPESLSEELLNKQVAEAIVVDWKGVPDPDDNTKMLPCTPENVLRMVKEFPDFRDDILTASMERATFQKAELEDAEGNSSSSSSGSSEQSPPTGGKSAKT